MKFQRLSLSKLEASDVNPRTITGDSPGIGELVESIQHHGVLVPLIVRQVGQGFTILAGHRRAVAAKLAGMTDVPCVIRAEEGPRAVEHLVENVVRLDLSPAEIAVGVMGALDTKKIKQKALAAELGKSEAWVSKYRTIGQALKKLGAIEDHSKAYIDGTGLYGVANADKLYELAQKYLEPQPENAAGSAKEGGEGGDGQGKIDLEPESWNDRVKRVAALGREIKKDWGVLDATSEPGVGAALEHIHLTIRFQSMAEARRLLGMKD